MAIIDERDVEIEEVKVEIVVEALDQKTDTFNPFMDGVNEEAQVQ